MGTVAIAGLSKRYGNAPPVLDAIDLQVEDGEFFTLLGPSGCGKTTLLRTIAGFLPQDAGTIAFDGAVVDALPAHRRDIGMVFQDYAIFPHLSVAENVAYGLRARRLKRAETQARVAEAIALVRLSGLESRSPGALSGGQQQRVGIARALAIRPRLLLMDEPLSNLDAQLRLEMREDIRAIQRRLGITTVYVTHDQEEALAISDRICVLQSGRIEQVGSPAEIYRRPARRFPAAFIGSMNFLPARIDPGGRLAFAGSIWLLDAPCPPGEVELALRPEAVRLGAGPASVTLRGSVERTVFLGRDSAITVGTAAGAVTLHAPFPVEPGTALDIALPFDAIALFTADGAGLPTRIAAPAPASSAIA